MATNKFYLKEIWSKGASSLGKWRRWVNLLWLFLASGLVCLGLKVTDGYIDVIISSLAIFTGFYFTLIVYVTDKAAQKIKEKEKDIETFPEIYKTFLRQYQEFSGNLISQICYSILIAIILIFLTLLTQVTFDFGCVNGYISWFEVYLLLINTIFLYTIFKLVHLILLIIGNMQAFFFEEFNNTDRYL